MATLKQINLARALAENRGRNITATELILKAGYSKETARTHQKQTLQGVGFVELLERGGCSNKRLEKVLANGLVAKSGKKADLWMRLRYAEIVMKAKGLLKEAQADQTSSLNSLIDNLKQLDVEVLIAIRQKLRTPEPENVTPIG